MYVYSYMLLICFYACFVFWFFEYRIDSIMDGGHPLRFPRINNQFYIHKIQKICLKTYQEYVKVYVYIYNEKSCISLKKLGKLPPYGCMVISLCIAQQGRGGRAQVGGYHRNWDHHTPKGELPMLFQRYTWHFDVSLYIYFYVLLIYFDTCF